MEIMRYAIQINDRGPDSEAVTGGYEFIKAALACGHEVLLVFFYHDGVMNAFSDPNALMIGPDWSTLAEKGIDLLVCTAASERRGPLGDNPTLRAGFKSGGLGSWVDACLKADRTLVFGVPREA